MQYENDEYMTELYQAAQEALENERDEDLEENPGQFAKYLAVMERFAKAASELGGRLQPFPLEPKYRCGGAEVVLPAFTAAGGRLKILRRCVEFMSAVSVDATPDDELYISAVIPDMYVRKGEAPGEEQPEDDENAACGRPGAELLAALAEAKRRGGQPEPAAWARLIRLCGAAQDYARLAGGCVTQLWSGSRDAGVTLDAVILRAGEEERGALLTLLRAADCFGLKPLAGRAVRMRLTVRDVWAAGER